MTESAVHEQPMPTDAYAWALAVLPIPLGVAAVTWAAIAAGDPTVDADGARTAFNIIALVATLGLTHMDHRVLHATGRWSMWGWIFLSPLAYLISRFWRLGGSPGPMLVAFATYGIWLTLVIVAVVAT